MGRNGKLTFKTNEACNGHDLASSPSLPNITTTIASDRFEYKGVNYDVVQIINGSIN